MKNITKRIIAIILTVTLAVTIYPAIGSARAEAAPADKVEKTEAAKAETKKDTKKAKDQNTAEAGDVKTVGNTTIAGNGTAVSAGGETEAGFNSVKVDTDAKTAEINWMGDARKIVVNFYDDSHDGEYKEKPPVYTKSVEVTPSPDELTTTNVTFDEKMPEYFILEILLQDGLGKDLTDPYVTNQYTEAIREVSDKTIDDFRDEGDRLVELAENAGAEEGSFLILADDVIRIDEGSAGQEGAEGVESTGGLQVEMMPANGGDQLCTLNNIDSELSRQLEDIEYGAPVFITDETVGANGTETSYAMFKAKSANVDRKSASAVLRGEVLDSAGENGEVNGEEMATYLKTANITNKHDYDEEIDIWLPGGITFKAQMKGTMKTQFIGNIYTPTLFEFSIIIIDDRYFEDAEVDVNLPSTVFDIPLKTFSLGVKGVVEFEVSINVRFSGSAHGGVRFDLYLPTYLMIGVSSRTGLNLNCISPDSESTFDGITLGGELFVGFAAGIAGKCVEILSISADLESGLVFSAEITSGQYWEGKRKYHACEDFKCIDGDISFKKLGYSICANAGNFSNGISGDLLAPALLTNFYISDTYDDSGFTECPHWGYRLKVHVTDQDDKDVAGAKISYDITYGNDYGEKDKERFEGLTSGTTDAKGIVTIYLPKNAFKLEITAEDEYGHQFKVSKDFNETGEPEKENLEVEIDMSRNKLSFIDTDQSGEAEDMPDPVYAYKDDTKATIPNKIPMKKGRVFVGWAKEQGSTTVDYKPRDKIEVNEDMQLYAVWAYSTYTINFDPNVPANATKELQGKMEPMTIIYDFDKKSYSIENGYDLPGWTFRGWSREKYAPYDEDIIKDNTITNEDLLNSDTDTITLYAQWAPKSYEVIFQNNGEKVGQQGIYYDTPTQLLSAEQLKLEKENSIFAYWTVEGDPAEQYPDKAKVTNLCNVNEDGSLTGTTLEATWINKTGATIIITDNGEFVNAGERISVTLKGFSDDTKKYDVTFVEQSPGIYCVESTSAAIDEGAYNVIFNDEALQAYNTDRTIDVDENFGVYNFDYYTVKAACDGKGTISVTKEDSTQVDSEDKLIRGTEINVTATAYAGHHFEQYTILGSDSGMKWDPTGAEQKLTVTGDMDIEAHFAPNRYQVVFHDNDGGEDKTITQDMVYGQQQNLFANQFERYGYNFAGWTKTSDWPGPASCDYEDKAQLKEKDIPVENGGELHLYAQWNPVSVMINFEPNDAEGEKYAQETFYETELLKCAFNRPYWDFVGWNTQKNGGGISYPDGAKFVLDDPVKNPEITLYAQWEPTEYTIDYDLAGGTVLKGNPTTYNINTEKFRLNNPQRVGYEFLGWTGTGIIEPEKTVTIEKGSHGNREYTANWKAEEKTLKFDPNGGEWEDGKAGILAKKADYDSTVTIPDSPTREHYTFEFWEDESGNKYIPGHEYKVRDNQEFKALWEPVQYVIEYDLAGGTIAEDANPAVYTTETDDFTLAAPERDGYVFLGWTGSNGDKPEKKVTISKGSHGNREYTANWKAEEKTLKFDPNGGEWEDGKTETLAKKADYDSTVIIPDAPAREHYTFEFWEDESGNKYIPGHEYKVRDDQEFKALWEPVQYVIEYDLAGGTVAEDANPTVYTTETDDFTLAAPERDGYIFLGWTGSNGDKPEKEVTIEKGSGGDKSYTANWEPVKTATPEDETKDKGTPTGDSFDPLLWGVLLLSSAAVLAVLYGRRRRSR